LKKYKGNACCFNIFQKYKSLESLIHQRFHSSIGPDWSITSSLMRNPIWMSGLLSGEERKANYRACAFCPNQEIKW